MLLLKGQGREQSPFCLSLLCKPPGVGGGHPHGEEGLLYSVQDPNANPTRSTLQVLPEVMFRQIPGHPGTQ